MPQGREISSFVYPINKNMRLTRAFKIASRNSLIVRSSPTVGARRQMSTEIQSQHINQLKTPVNLKDDKLKGFEILKDIFKK